MRALVARFWMVLALLGGVGCLGGDTSGPAADGGGGGAGGAKYSCTDLFNKGSPPTARCCPWVRPDCSDKPDGFTEPGETGVCVDASTGGASFCSCQCLRGEWWCGC